MKKRRQDVNYLNFSFIPADFDQITSKVHNGNFYIYEKRIAPTAWKSN